MKKALLMSSLLLTVLCFSNCNKEIDEPKQKADGRNLIYLKIDNNEEYLLDSRSKFFHKKTASNLDKDGSINYSEYTINNKVVSEFYIGFNPLKYKKANFEGGSIRLRFDKETQVLDTAFLNNWPTKNYNKAIYFDVRTDEYKQYIIDSILDFKIIKWDKEKEILTFSANCTYSLSPKTTPPNPQIYFYFDISY